MNSHDKGKQLELEVASLLQEIFQENPPIRPTKASSGGERNTEFADLNSSNVYCECKNDGSFFKLKIWQKLLNSLPFGTTKKVLYVINHPIEGRLVMLSLSDLINLLKERR